MKILVYYADMHIFTPIEGIIMRIILYTERGRIIKLPKSFFPQLDKSNKILANVDSDKAALWLQSTS